MIVDEILTFFMAGMKTIQVATANLIMYMTLNPAIRNRMLEEVSPALAEAGKDIVEGLAFEQVMNFDYLQRCFNESLRIEPSLPITSSQCFDRDVKINGVTFPAHQAFVIGIQAIHHDQS